jgi:hypothetical protein
VQRRRAGAALEAAALVGDHCARIGKAAQKPDYPSSTRRLMSDRMTFDTVCPNNHNQTVSFSREEFEEALKSDTLMFHCNTCDTDWPPSSEEIAKLRKHFSKS